MTILDNLNTARQALITEARSLLDAAEGETRDLNTIEQTRFDAITAELDTISTRAASIQDIDRRQAEIDASMARLAGVVADVGEETDARRDLSVGRHLGAAPSIHFSDDQVAELHEGFMVRRSVTVAAETRAVTLATAPMGGVAHQLLEPVPVRTDQVRIADLLPTQQIEAPQATYYRASVGADAAASVAEGGAKPESDPQWVPVTATARKLAHFVDVSWESLDDYANFEQVVRSEMIRGVIDVENSQVLNGTGVGTDLLGLLAQPGILTYAPAVAELRLFSLLHATTLLRTGAAFTEAGTIVVHPTDWEVVRRSPASDGDLLVSPNPTGPTPFSLWGVPVVVTARIAAGTALVANMAEGGLVFSRQPVTIMVDPFSQSANNLVRFIAEERIAVGSPRPAALCKVTFNGAT